MVNGGLSKKQRDWLQKLIDELNTVAKNVFDDYTDNPSELSGSITQIAEGSPLLDDEDDTKWTHKRNSKETNDFNSIKTLQSRKC